jgi:ABC-type multidrug transport system permease subunit
MIERIAAIFFARNIEFMRDRASVAWNVVVPIVLVFGLGLVFSRPETDQFIVGIVAADSGSSHPFLDTRYIDFTPVADVADAGNKVARHQLDMLVQLEGGARYWVNPESPKGYIVERLLLQSDPTAVKQTISGQPIRYVDWLVPGVLGMNMMFSCLFGVGYVVVRYRKNGFLKRLRATPLSAFEFITAQALSRLMLTLVISAAVFMAVSLILDITMMGSYVALLAVAAAGCAALIALSLVIAARASSEELANGLLNMLSWPMMLLSGVFYSLESSAEWIQSAAKIFPLTHMLSAARAIMIDGAGLVDVASELIVLALMTAAALIVSSTLFRWRFV